VTTVATGAFGLVNVTNDCVHECFNLLYAPLVIPLAPEKVDSVENVVTLVLEPLLEIIGVISIIVILMV